MFNRAVRRSFTTTMHSAAGGSTPPAVFSPTTVALGSSFEVPSVVGRNSGLSRTSSMTSLGSIGSHTSAVPLSTNAMSTTAGSAASNYHHPHHTTATYTTTRSIASATELAVNEEPKINPYEMLCAQEEDNPNKLWMTLSCSGDKLMSNITGEAGTQRIAHNHSHSNNPWQASCIEVRRRQDENPVISLRRLAFNKKNDSKKAPWEKESKDDVEVVHYFETHSEEGLEGYTNVATRVAVGELPGTCNNQTGEGFAQWIVPRQEYIDLIKTRPLLDVLRGSRPPQYRQTASKGTESNMDDYEPTDEFQGRPMIHVQANSSNPYSNAGSRWNGTQKKKKDGLEAPIDDEEMMASLEAILTNGGKIHLKKDDSNITHETGSLAAYATAFTQEEDGDAFFQPDNETAASAQ